MNESINLTAVLLASVAQFILGAIWYTPLFGRMWGKIHGFDKLKQKTQKEMQKQMMPLLIVQLLVTILTTFVLAHVLKAWPAENPYKMAFWMWLGFMLPVQVSAVVFGGTEPRWILAKIAIMAGGALACIEAGALVLAKLQ